MNTYPTINTEYPHWRRGEEWARVKGIFHLELWKPGYEDWSFAGYHAAPHGSGWVPQSLPSLRDRIDLIDARATVDLLSSEKASLTQRVAELKASRDYYRSKYSALRLARRDTLPAPKDKVVSEPAPVVRFYHTDKFTGSVKFIESTAAGLFRVFENGNRERVEVDVPANTYVDCGIWIEVRGTNIPFDLPKPPPVPEGFSHWEYRANWKDFNQLHKYSYFNRRRWDAPPKEGYPAGMHQHYLEAKSHRLQVVLVKGYLDEPEDEPAPPPPTTKTRVFRHVREFGDDTDRVELVGNTATIITKDGRRIPAARFPAAQCEKAVSMGDWYEVKEEPPLKVKIQKLATVVMRGYIEAKEAAVRAALVHKFGEVPPMESIMRHLHRVIDLNRVEHWLWLDGPLRVGELAPLDKAICRINPPSFTPNPES